MANESKCLKCGAPLNPDARDGVCPKCLLGQALATDSAESVSDADATPASRPPRLTVRYVGDYELLEEIAHGGMGVVWRARQASLDRFVALKMIRAGELASEEEVKRFIREAQAAANLAHPNIVSIYEVGRHEGMHYFSMRLVEGESLAVVAASRQSAALSDEKDSAALCRDAATLLSKVARAVHHAHERGILHRDLKPGNILIDASGEPHVTDFGLAKRVDMPSDLTRTESVMGTPNYMSPEQAQGRNHDLTPASDIFSLGAVLYHLLTGRPPFVAATAWETLKAVVEREPVRPRTLNRRVDRDLETICLKCLEKDPQRRYGSAEELAGDLDRWLKQEPIRARPVSEWDYVVKWVKRNPAIASLAAAVVILAGLAAAQLAWQGQRPDDSAMAEMLGVGPAAIAVQPQNQAAPPGSNVTFLVVPAGERPLSFQWKKDGVELVNDDRVSGAATPRLSIASMRSEDLGSYTLVVSNAHASVTTEAAVLLFTPPGFEWGRSFGGPGQDACGDPAAVDPQGDLYLAGDFALTAQFEGTTLTSMGSRDVWVAKFNHNGALQWACSAGGHGSDGGGRSAVDQLGNVYVSGDFSGTATFAHTNLTSAGKRDVFVAKYDRQGDLLWARQIGGSDDAESFGDAADEAGGCLVTGYFQGTATFGSQTLTSAGRQNFFLARYDANGVHDWAVRGGGSWAGCVALDQAGNCYITGVLEKTADVGGVVLGVKSGVKKIFVAKYSKAGLLLWAKQLEPENQGGHGIAFDPSRNAYVVGHNASSISVTKLSPEGLQLWQQNVSGSFDMPPAKIAADSAGNCFAICSLRGKANFGGVEVRSAQSIDVCIAKFSPQGILQWIQRSEGPGDGLGRCLAIGQAGEIYVVGTYSGTESFGPHRLASQGETDIFVAKLIDWPQATGARPKP